MVPAAVGFQCPACVRQGVRATRSGQLPYGGRPSANPQLTSLVLIGINALIWVWIQLQPGLVDTLALLPRGGVRPVSMSAAELVPGVSMGSWWQIITSGFAHVQLFHIGMNMAALYFLGPPLEQVLGRGRFLAIYGLSLLTGSATVMLFSAPNQATLGASGAIFGLLGALMVIAYKVRGNPGTIATWLIINLVITFTVPNISWQGHLGGLIGGALLAAAMVYAPRPARNSIQWGTMIGLTIIAVGAIIVRALMLGSLLS